MFSYNSKFNQTVNQIIDCLFLSLLWLVSSLPVVTVGAATTALYHTVDTVFRQEKGSLWKEYWRVFRRDFRRATGLWLLMLLILLVMAGNVYAAFFVGIQNGTLLVLLQIGAVFLMAVMAVWMQCWFPYLSRFDDPVKIILKNTIAMMMGQTKVAVKLLALFVLVVVLDGILAQKVPILTLVMPVAYICALNRVLEPMFAHYMALQKATDEETQEV